MPASPISYCTKIQISPIATICKTASLLNCAMHSKILSMFRNQRGCVLAQNKHVGAMEVGSYRIAGILFAVLMWVPTLNAQTATNLTTNAIANTNALRAAIPVARELDNQHRLRAGDKLSFRVAEDGEEAKPLQVTDSGEIELPLGFGRFNASGKTCRALAQEIKVALEKDYYKRATVQLA